MTRRSILAAAIVVMAISALTPSDATADDTGTGPPAGIAVPQIKLAGHIDLSDMGRASWVQRISFSPDSRYLAIADTPTVKSDTIIVWDLQRNREQTRITGLPEVATHPNVEILWSPNGKSITFGAGVPITFWDPITGRKLKELTADPPIQWSRYSKDGSKLLVSRATRSSGFRIYDTRTWSFRDYGNGGLVILSLSWTADDNVLVAGIWPKSSVGHTLDGIVPGQADAIARIVGPSGRQSPRSVVISPATHQDLKGAYSAIPLESFWPEPAVVNYRTNKVALGVGKIIDGRTLRILSYAPDNFSISDLTFGANGNYLYLLEFIGKRPAHGLTSLVLNARNSVHVASFPAGQNGLAASPDGKHLAVGNGQSVNLYDVK